jgi:hypothetical protein
MRNIISRTFVITICLLTFAAVTFNYLKTVYAGPVATVVVSSGSATDWYVNGTGTATAKDGDWIIDSVSCSILREDTSTVNGSCATATDGTYDAASEEFTIFADIYQEPAGNYYVEIFTDEYSPGLEQYDFSDTITIPFTLDENGNGQFDLSSMPGLKVVIDSGPTVVGNDVTISGHGESQGGDFYISEFEVYLNGQFQLYAPAVDGAFDEATEEFVLEFNDLAPDDYVLEIHVWETDGNTTNNTHQTGAHVENFTVNPASAVLQVTSGPTVNGDDMSISGTATARDASWQIGGFMYVIPEYSSGTIDAEDGSFDGEQTEEFTLTVPDIPNGDYNIEIYAIENDGTETEANSNTVTEPFTVNVAPPPVDIDIVLNEPFTTSTSSYITVTGSATDNNGYNITGFDGYYTNMPGDHLTPTASDGVFDEPTEEFEFIFGPFPDDEVVTFSISAINSEAQSEFVNDSATVNNSSAAAVCELSNHPTPTSDNTPTHTVTCTSPDNITSMQYRINNEVDGSIVGWTEIAALTSGTYGSTSVSASITPGVQLPDGNTSIFVNAYTGTGKRLADMDNETSFSYDPPTPIDIFVVETQDNNPPTIKLNPILPNPITSTSPYITGSCQDVHTFDTNTTIATLEYRIDAGSWVSLPPLDGSLDSAIEYFSFQLPTQAQGAHTVEVRCIDVAGQDTDATAEDYTLDFEIIPQPDVDPLRVEVTEDFTDNALNSVNETTAIWGNGYIRLKEKILFGKTVLDSNGYVDRYGQVLSAQFPLVGNGNYIFYGVDLGVSNFGIRRYNTQNSTTTEYDNLSVERIYDIEYFTANSNEYLLYSTRLGLSIYNITTDTIITGNFGGLNTDPYDPREIYRDPRNANLGFYVHNETEYNVEQSNLYYLDLNGTPDNLADDQHEWYSTVGGFNFVDVNQLLLADSDNRLYVSSFNVGLIRIDDNATPLNIADDTRTLFNTTDHLVLNRLSGLAKDPNDDGIFLTGHASYSVLLYLNTMGTDSPADDEIVELSNQLDLKQQRIDNIAFLEGPQYVGGQLFMMTRTGKLLYHNTNGTYSSNTDDTTILLETNEGLYPEYISDIYFSDYNTIYANFQHTGMTRIDLNRSWENTGDAVTISIPPEVRLIVNNINLEEVIVGPLLEDEDGALEPNSGEIGIQYFVSIDDGVTYEEFDVGELKTVLEEDYRLKLKITLTKIGENSKTPIINGFTVAYGAYQDAAETQAIDSLEITTPVTSFNTNANFPITVRALDVLGYPVIGFNQPVTLQLKDFGSSSPVSGLTPTTINLVDGEATINNAQISQAGSYKITATYTTFSDDSPQLTVSDAPASSGGSITPTLSFSVDKPTIPAGGTAILSWNTTNASSVVINGYGNVPVNGTLSVSPTQTTTYYITVTDSEGDTLTASLTITVIDAAGNEAPVSIPVSEDGTPIPLTLTIPDEYIEVLRGNKVTVEWKTEGNPDSVYIDYLGRDATSSGSFEFIPERDIVITITATRGDQTITRTITIKVIDGLPNIYIPAIVAATGILASSLITGSVAQYFAMFLGLVLFRRKKYWGIVYNTTKSVPIPFVTVRVYRMVMNKKEFVAQTISDLEGKYGIPIGEAGNYQVEFIHEGYRTEVKELLIQQNSDIILDVGMNEINTDSLALISRLRIFFKENAKIIMQWLRVALIALMVAGAYITLQVIKLSPLPLNYIVLGIYILAIVTQVIVLLSPYINMKRGRVIEITSKRPVKGAVFRILGENQRAIQGVESISFTNESGVVKIRISPGKYDYQVSKPGYEANSGDMKIDESGKITETIYMKKGTEQFGG